jgi:hypothetical protein
LTFVDDRGVADFFCRLRQPIEVAVVRGVVVVVIAAAAGKDYRQGAEKNDEQHNQILFHGETSEAALSRRTD